MCVWSHADEAIAGLAASLASCRDRGPHEAKAGAASGRRRALRSFWDATFGRMVDELAGERLGRALQGNDCPALVARAVTPEPPLWHPSAPPLPAEVTARMLGMAQNVTDAPVAGRAIPADRMARIYDGAVHGAYFDVDEVRQRLLCHVLGGMTGTPPTSATPPAPPGEQPPSPAPPRRRAIVLPSLCLLIVVTAALVVHAAFEGVLRPYTAAYQVEAVTETAPVAEAFASVVRREDDDPMARFERILGPWIRALALAHMPERALTVATRPEYWISRDADLPVDARVDAALIAADGALATGAPRAAAAALRAALAVARASGDDFVRSRNLLRVAAEVRHVRGRAAALGVVAEAMESAARVKPGDARAVALARVGSALDDEGKVQGAAKLFGAALRALRDHRAPSTGEQGYRRRLALEAIAEASANGPFPAVTRAILTDRGFDPSDDRITTAVAAALAAQGQERAALRLAKRTASLLSRRNRLAGVGLALARHGKLARARRATRQALQIVPASAHGVVVLGLAPVIEQAAGLGDGWYVMRVLERVEPAAWGEVDGDVAKSVAIGASVRALGEDTPPVRARAELRTAVRLADSIGDEALRYRALAEVVEALYRLPALSRSRAVRRELVGPAIARGGSVGVAMVAMTALEGGAPTLGREMLDDGMALIARGPVSEQGPKWAGLAELLAAEGQGIMALQVAERVTDEKARVRALLRVAGVLHDRGDAALSRRALGAAHEAARRIAGDDARSRAFADIAKAYAREGRLREARFVSAGCACVDKLDVYATMLTEFAAHGGEAATTPIGVQQGAAETRHAGGSALTATGGRRAARDGASPHPAPRCSFDRIARVSR